MKLSTRKSSRTRKTFQPQMEQLEVRALCAGMIGVDNTEAYPYRAVAHVSSWFDFDRDNRKDWGETSSGSASMVSRDSALTSAHVVYNSSRGVYAKSVTITPGRDGTNVKPFGTFTARNFRIPSAYRTQSVAALDIAVLNFARTGTRAVGDVVGWLGYSSSYTTTQLKGMTVNNIGYPGESKSGVDQYRSTGPLIDSRGVGNEVRVLQYNVTDIPVEKGSSGSPIYVLTSGNRYVIGVHSRRVTSNTIGQATQITPKIFSFITQARRALGTGGGSITFNVSPISSPITPGGFFLDSNLETTQPELDPSLFSASVVTTLDSSLTNDKSASSGADAVAKSTSVSIVMDQPLRSILNKNQAVLLQASQEKDSTAEELVDKVFEGGDLNWLSVLPESMLS